MGGTGSLRPDVSVILKHAVYGDEVWVYLGKKLGNRADVSKRT